MSRAVLTLLALLVAGPPINAQQRDPIIDMHVHAGPSDDSRETMLALMDELQIVKAFLSGSVDDVQRWEADTPGRFMPSPMFPVFGVEEESLG